MGGAGSALHAVGIDPVAEVDFQAGREVMYVVQEREPRFLAGRGALRLQPRPGNHRGPGDGRGVHQHGH